MVSPPGTSRSPVLRSVGRGPSSVHSGPVRRGYAGRSDCEAALGLEEVQMARVEGQLDEIAAHRQTIR